MEFEKININQRKQRVLIAPLDWGLGHATRCIPIIYALISLNFEVIIAVDGPIKNLLKKEFPDVVFTHLKGYKIRYSRQKSWLPVKLLSQFPKLLWRIYREHQQLKAIISAHKIDVVISDNRLGLYSTVIPSVYITHQLKIKTGNAFSERLAQKIHYFFINKYTACWVPDNESENNLAGELSHPLKKPAVPVKYLGPLSRFEKIETQKKYDVLVLLSGPEPQRTIFENLLQEELKKFTGTVLLVIGLPEAAENNSVADASNKITVVNHLAAGDLNKAIQQAKLVICRSGYTTIMDLIKLQQKAVLVPTPGQTEQEYLAKYLMEKKLFFAMPQNNFSLATALENAFNYPFVNITIEQGEYKKVITAFADELKTV